MLLAADLRGKRAQTLGNAGPTTQNLTITGGVIAHSRFHADTGQVSSYRHGQGGLQAQPWTECQHHHARLFPDWRPSHFFGS